MPCRFVLEGRVDKGTNTLTWILKFDICLLQRSQEKVILLVSRSKNEMSLL